MFSLPVTGSLGSTLDGRVALTLGATTTISIGAREIELGEDITSGAKAQEDTSSR